MISTLSSHTVDKTAITKDSPASLGRALILLVLAAAIVPRLPHVWAPISGWQTHRQADTAAIARNFYREGMNILYPAIDWRGAGPGYVETEFQAFPFLAACLYKIFGVHVACGRVLALLFSVGAAVYMARLCSRYSDRWTGALAAAAFSLFPMYTYYGVAFMPEPLMIFASVAAIDHMDRWSHTGRERHRWISALFLALAIAVKLPQLFLGVPVAYLVWRRLGWRMVAQVRVWLCALVALVPAALWYWHANQLREQTGLTFDIWGRGAGHKMLNRELLTSLDFYTGTLSALTESHLNYGGTLLLVIGWILLRRRHRAVGLFKWWIGGTVLYLLVVAHGNTVHDYYQMPVLPPLALGVGTAVAWAIKGGRKTPARVGGVVLVAVFLILSIVRNVKLVQSEITSAPELRRIGTAAQQIVPRGTLVIAFDNNNPAILYHADRKGWHATPERLTEDWIEARRLEGAAYLLAPAKDLERPEIRSKLEMLQERYANRSSIRDVYVFDLRNP